MDHTLIDENKTLKKKINHLSKKLIMNKIEVEMEMETIKRRASLLQLLIPKFDLEDISSGLIAFLFRVFPFDKAVIVLKKDNIEFIHTTSTMDGKIIFQREAKKCDPAHQELANYLIDEIRKTRQSFFVEDLDKINDSVLNKIITGKTCFAIPIFFSVNSICICYIESNKSGSYSEREVDAAEQLLKATSFPFLNAIRFSNNFVSHYKDPFTGLYNKTYMLKLLENQLILSESTLVPFTIIKISPDKFGNHIEKFKNVYFIKTIKSLKRIIRAVDMIFVDDEYSLTLLIHNANSTVAKIVGSRIVNHIESNLTPSDNLKINFGAYTYNPGIIETHLEIIEKVMLALEKSKFLENESIYYL